MESCGDALVFVPRMNAPRHGLLATFSNDSGAVLRWILGLMVLFLDSPGQLLPWSSDSENHVSESFSVRIVNVSLIAPAIVPTEPIRTVQWGQWRGQ